MKTFSSKGTGTLALVGSVLFLCMSTALHGQKVYVERYPSQADVRLFLTQNRSDADIVVFRVPYRSQAAAEKGLWFETPYRSQADWRIVWVPYRSQADCVVYMAPYRSQARPNRCFARKGKAGR